MHQIQALLQAPLPWPRKQCTLRLNGGSPAKMYAWSGLSGTWSHTDIIHPNSDETGRLRTCSHMQVALHARRTHQKCVSSARLHLPPPVARPPCLCTVHDGKLALCIVLVCVVPSALETAGGAEGQGQQRSLESKRCACKRPALPEAAGSALTTGSFRAAGTG